MPQQVNIAPVVLIQVLSLAPAPAVEVKTGSVALAGTDCKLPTGLTSNLVQDTGVINLNQPANCFALNDQVLVKSQTVNLSVDASSKLYTPLVVINSKSRIASETYSTGHAENKILSIPELSVSALTVLAFAFSRKIKEAKRNFETKIYNNFSLNRFEVLRC